MGVRGQQRHDRDDPAVRENAPQALSIVSTRTFPNKAGISQRERGGGGGKRFTWRIQLFRYYCCYYLGSRQAVRVAHRPDSAIDVDQKKKIKKKAVSLFHSGCQQQCRENHP